MTNLPPSSSIFAMTSEEIHFDPRSIDVCVDSLLRLKKDGRYNPNGLWDSEILPRCVQLLLMHFL